MLAELAQLRDGLMEYSRLQSAATERVALLEGQLEAKSGWRGDTTSRLKRLEERLATQCPR